MFCAAVERKNKVYSCTLFGQTKIFDVCVCVCALECMPGFVAKYSRVKLLFFVLSLFGENALHFWVRHLTYKLRKMQFFPRFEPIQCLWPFRAYFLWNLTSAFALFLRFKPPLNILLSHFFTYNFNTFHLFSLVLFPICCPSSSGTVWLLRYRLTQLKDRGAKDFGKE